MPSSTEVSRKILRTAAINAGLLAFTLALVAAYLALEVHESIRSAVWPSGSFAYDRDAGYVFSPKAPFPARISGRYSVRIHPLGFRIPPDASTEDPGPGGVLGIGSSNTFGVDVECEQTYVARLAAKLGRAAYNFGVPSYGYPNVLQRLRELNARGVLTKLKPSVVVTDLGSLQEAYAFAPIHPVLSLYAGVPYFARGPAGLTVVQEPDVISIRNYFELLDRYRLTPGEIPGITWDRLEALLAFSPQAIASRLLGLKTGDSGDVIAAYRYFFHELERLFPDPAVRIAAVWIPVEEGERMPSLITEAAKDTRVQIVDGSELAREGNRIHPGPPIHEVFAEALKAAIQSGNRAF